MKTSKTLTSQPLLEKIEPEFGSSFTVKHFDSIIVNDEPYWHFHPEIEIAAIRDGSGKRHIGSHLSYYKKGDLIMIGPNLPHYGFRNRFSSSQDEVIVQMKENFLGDDFLETTEMYDIKSLFKRSKTGIRFHGNTKRQLMDRFYDLPHMSPFERMTSFLSILNTMATTEEYSNLNAGQISFNVNSQDNERITTIYKYVRSHFNETIMLDDVAQLVNMTTPSFCRYFKKITKKTFIEFLNEFRIVHACKLLGEDHLSIAEVSLDCGFNNFSHFAKSFKKITGKTPSQYRKTIKLVVY